MVKRILFLCTHNSCRSQMAEGLVNHFLGNKYQAYSAGTEATAVNPKAIAVMAEIGIDISRQWSKTLDEFSGEKFDLVITLCGDANDKCPLFIGGAKRTHFGFADPSKSTGTDDEITTEFRRVRDDMKETLVTLLDRD